LIYGDYLLAHTHEAVDVQPLDFGPLPAKDWAVDGTLAGTGRSRNVNSLGFRKHARRSQSGIDPESFWKELQAKHDEMERSEARCELEHTAGAELVVVAFGSVAKFVRHVVRELRAEGVRVGYARPITLWPFPSEAIARACAGARRVAVLEQNGGQMIDDVKLAILGRTPVIGIGEISTDSSGFGIGKLLDPERIRHKIESALPGREAA
jgi:2-oxoglutarate ferredoxin oxidoreductase subunit alpha